MNIIDFYQKVSNFNYLLNNYIVLVLCEKNMFSSDLIHNNTSSNQSKKTEKNEMTPKYKNTKSNEILKDSNKNSYFNKYIEEYNRNKLNKKTSSLRQSKKNEQKETGIGSHPNSIFSYKKSKNNSLDKNIGNNYNLNNNPPITVNLRKSAKDLTKEFNESKNSDKSNNIITMTPRYISQSNNFLLNVKNKPKILEKKTTNIQKSEKNEIQSKPPTIPKIKNLSQKENAYLILSYSKCLRLCERMIFSRSTNKLRESISKKQILDTNKIYLEEKIKELEKQIENCDDKLKTQFNATKTAEMTLNYITSNVENEFKLNLFNNIYDENEKIYCYKYVKILYLLLGENYEEIKNENLIKQLYQKINNKGYKNIKDYLYVLYIKNIKENKISQNIDKINDILLQGPDLLNFKYTFRYDKFISYTCFLFKEIINFSNEKIDTYKLKKECINLIDIVNNKINLYKEKYSKK